MKQHLMIHMTTFHILTALTSCNLKIGRISTLFSFVTHIYPCLTCVFNEMIPLSRQVTPGLPSFNLKPIFWLVFYFSSSILLQFNHFTTGFLKKKKSIYWFSKQEGEGGKCLTVSQNLWRYYILINPCVPLLDKQPFWDKQPNYSGKGSSDCKVFRK